MTTRTHEEPATPEVSTVPETHERGVGDAGGQLRRSDTGHLFLDAAMRLHALDGTTYARALAHTSITTLIPAVIAVIGLVTTFGLEDMRRLLEDAATSFAPGPAGGILTDAITQAKPSSAALALVAGVAGMLFSGTIGMMHLERAANRIYGVAERRGAVRRWVIALALAATVEVMLIAALAVIVAGGSIGEGSNGARPESGIWPILRWPIGVGLVAVAMTVIFKVVPNRRQPGFSWLLPGTTVSVVTWVLATMVLGLVYERVSSLGGSYGPLLGVLALLVWAFGTGLAVLFGLAFAAQLEAQRAASGDDPAERRAG
jgi:YihY family inner membrane protein